MHEVMSQIYGEFSVNLIDGEAQWFIPYAPNSSLRPSRDSFNFETLDKALSYPSMDLLVQSMVSPHSDLYHLA